MILKSKNFDISPFSKLGKNVISDFQGLFNSSILISGTSNSPILKNLIKTENVIIEIPYLNIQYDLKNNPSFVLEGQSFFINNFTLFNQKSNSEGVLTGEISHKRFKDWDLDLKINSDNLMILNTLPSPSLAYYGTGMLNGESIIKGPVNTLSINVKIL